MTDALLQRFIETLGRLEADGDVEPIAGLFADGADIGNSSTEQTFSGPDGAREFWSGYRAAFGEVRSEFRRTYAVDDAATLEWRSRATIGGRSFEYDGVSLLEGDGERITRFRAYFDPRAITGETV